MTAVTEEHATAPAATKKAARRAPKADVAPRAKKTARKATAAKKAPQGAKAAKPPVKRENSKSAQVLELLDRSTGATLTELMAATGWQAHSVRGFLSGAVRKKMGLTLASTKRADGQRTYYTVTK